MNGSAVYFTLEPVSAAKHYAQDVIIGGEMFKVVLVLSFENVPDENLNILHYGYGRGEFDYGYVDAKENKVRLLGVILVKTGY